MQKVKCELCKIQPAMPNNVLCHECSKKYDNLLRSAIKKTRSVTAQLDPSHTRSETQQAQQAGLHEQSELLLEKPQMITEEQRTSHVRGKQIRTTHLLGFVLLGIGLLSLLGSVLVTSTILTFIGLGLVFWGALVFFIQPHQYVRSELINATALSAMKTIDKILVGIGYRERGVYVPGGADKVVMFIPSEAFSRVPSSTEIEGKTFLDNPEGLLAIPPGLVLSNMIEKKLPFKLMNCGVENLVQALPKVLIEDLELVKDVQIRVTGNVATFKLINSVYADFCREVHESSRRCGFGCPLCSALACVLAVASGKPVLPDEDTHPSDKMEIESSFRLLDESARLYGYT